MRRFAQRLFKSTSGSVLIYTALAIFALTAMGVIGVDISRMLVARVQLGNAADAGALAGVVLLSMNPGASQAEVELRAAEVASENGSFAQEGVEPIPMANIQASADIDGSPQTVRVITESNVSSYFTGVVGEALFKRVSAYAEAQIGEVCNSTCLKPWSIPDRHDDTSPIAGYPEWANNGLWDGEDFTDQNDSEKWEPGEPYTDGNGNGSYDREFYHPLITGYVASRDHGLQLTLKGNNGSKPAPSQYYPVDLPDENGDQVRGGDWYRTNIATCNPANISPGDLLWTENGNMVGPTAQGMRRLYDQDPDAYWDTNCSCVSGSAFAQSPRIGIIPIHDPQIPMDPGKQTILVTKLAAFFIEEIRGNGEVAGRFMRLAAPGGDICPAGETSGGFLFTYRLTDTE